MLKGKLNLKEMKQEFDLGVSTEAEYTPNATEFYSRAFAGMNIENIRLIPGIKNSEKIGRLDIGGANSVLKEFGCGWPTPVNTELDATKIEVADITVPFQVCKSDLEESFARLVMTEGKDGWKDANMFWNHFYGQVENRIGEDLGIAKWQGQSGTGLATITGLETHIATSGNTNEVAFSPAAYTVSNIESAFEDLLVALPDSIARKKNDIVFYVSPSVKNMIMISMGKNNTSFYLTEELAPAYAGIKISEEPGMSGDMIVLTRSENLVVGVDALSDLKDVKVRDLDVIAEPVIRLRADFKFGTQILNDEEIFYTLATV